jgi:nitrogen fixation NifU-like protein
MYNPTVMDHFQNPRNTGEIEDADGIGEVGNPNCGDVMRLYIKVSDNRLVDVKFKTFGCAAAIATSSAASEMVVGKTLEEAMAITRDQVANRLDGLPPQKMACSNLAPDAIRAAIADYRYRQEQG